MRIFIIVALCTLLIAACGRSKAPAINGNKNQHKRSVTSAHDAKAAPQQNRASGGDSGNGNPPSSPEHWTDVYTANATVVMAILGALQFIILYRSLTDTKTAANAAKVAAEVAINGQRAYLVIAPTRHHTMDGELTFSLAFKNVGQIPASLIRCAIQCMVEPSYDIATDIVKCEELNGDPFPRLIVPKDSVKSHNTNSIIITAEEFKKPHVYVFGWVEYFDGYKKDRRHHFCFIVKSSYEPLERVEYEQWGPYNKVT